MSKKISCSIDIGTHTTRVVAIVGGKGQSEDSVITSGVETRGMKSGYITNTEHISESLKKAVSKIENTTKTKIKRAHVSIGGISLLSQISYGEVIISRADQEVTHLDVTKVINISEEALSLVNKKIIHIIPLAYKIDGKEIHGRPEGMHGVKLEVKTLFVTCLKQNIEDLVTVMELSGIEIIDATASPIASARILLSEKQKNVGCALLDIGAETVSLSVFENSTLISLQVFQIGSMDITKDIALGLKISLEEAESIKIGSLIGDYPKKKIDEIIEARLSDIFELVENHLKKIRRNGLLPAGIVIYGAGSQINNIENIAKRDLKLPARVGPQDISIYNKYKIRDESWYPVLGIAIAPDSLSMSDITIQGSFGENIKEAKSFFKSFLSQLLP
jgi:cell division protein FtsA